MTEHSERRSILFVLGAMAAFSMMAVFTRSAGVSVYSVAAWRAVIVTAVFGVWTFWEGGVSAFRVDRTTRRLAIFMGVAQAIASATFVGGYAYTTVANTIFLHNLAPVFVFPLAWWAFRERPSVAALTGVGIAIVGIAMLSGVSLFQAAHFSSLRFLMGDGLAFTSAIGYAGVLVATRAARREQTPLVPTLFYLWVVSMVILVAVAVVADTMAIGWSALAWITGLAIVCTNLPFYLLNLGMKKVSAPLAAVISLSEVVFATLLGLVVYGENLSPAGWLGGMLAAFGVFYAVRMNEREGGEEPEQGSALTGGSLRLRGARLGLALFVLNVGAVGALLGGEAGGMLLAWLALLRLGRLAPAVVTASLSPGAGRIARWIGLVVGAAVALGVVFRTGSDASTPPLAFVGALAFLWVDRALSAREAEAERDPDALGSLALALLVVSGMFQWLGHPAESWAIYGSRVLALAAAIELLSGGARAPIERRAAIPVLRGAERVGRWLQPGRALAAVLALWAVGGLRVVPAGHVGIIERFGAPRDRVEVEGLVVALPPPLDHLVLVDVGRVHRVPILENDSMLCGDQSMVSLEATLHYQVSDPKLWAYGASDVEAVLVELARSALVERLASLHGDAVLTDGRLGVEREVRELTQAAADEAGLGVQVSSLYLATAAVPAPVLAAFLDVISADEERQTRINEAQAYSADVLPKAGGDAVIRTAQAASQALQTTSAASGDHAHFLALSKGGADAPRLTRERLALEAAERKLSAVRLVVLPTGQRLWLGDGSARPRKAATDSKK